MAVSESVNVLRDGGTVARRLPEYEHRPQQLQLAAAVEAAFARKEHLIAEAGTGVGKSFAYLVPAVLKATSGEDGAKPVVISTGTIALQEQLVTKDIPFLRSVWDREFSAVLVKGRGNYISRRRLRMAVERTAGGALFPREEEAQLERISEWADENEDGSRSDLGFDPLPAVWEQVVSESTNCLGRKCPTFETCTFQRARRRMFNANLLIVNHHLLFADLSLKMQGVSYLPDYEYLVLDEAHDVEKIASEHLGIRLSRGGVEWYLNTVNNSRSGRGVVATHSLPQTVAEACEEARYSCDAFFDDVLQRLHSGGREPRIRLREANQFETDAPDTLRKLYFALKQACEALDNEEAVLEVSAAAKRAMSIADSIDNFVQQALGGQVYWIEGVESRRGINVELRAAPIHAGDLLREHLFTQAKSVVMTSATLATGAAKSGASPFRYIRDRLGLGQAEAGDDFAPEAVSIVERALAEPLPVVAHGDGEGESSDVDALLAGIEPPLGDAPPDAVADAPAPPRQPARPAANNSDDETSDSDEPAALDSLTGPLCRELLVGSPFDYEKQAVLRVPMLPEPNTHGYEDALSAEVLTAVRAARGGTFILFTSYSEMTRVHAAVRPRLELEGYTLLKQGDGTPRSRMLELFRAGRRMVLFGAESFWQGVDVPGDALSSVVIAKLPFSVPTDPLIAARTEDIEQRGGNAFMEYSVPQAIMKLKQGFGRLIRRATDTGTVTILDSRVRTKRYGRAFLEALPPARREMP
jgi:ATP-dependent DNA helicase DinG